MRPHAGPEGRAGEQPRRRRRRLLGRRGGARASPGASADEGSAACAPGLDLDDFRFVRAVGDVGLAAAGADARVLREVLPLLRLIEVRPRRAAMPGAPAAGRARASRTASPPSRSCCRTPTSTTRPARTKLLVPRIERRDPVPELLHLGRQRRVLHAQGHDRGTLPCIDAGLREKPAQPRDLLLQRERALRRPADLLTSSRAASSFARLFSRNVSRLLARSGPAPPATAAPRHAPPPRPPASASSAARSLSKSDFQSTDRAPAKAAGPPSSSASGAGGVPKSSKRISMRGAIARRLSGYQCRFRSGRNRARTDCRHLTTERLPPDRPP